MQLRIITNAIKVILYEFYEWIIHFNELREHHDSFNRLLPASVAKNNMVDTIVKVIAQ